MTRDAGNTILATVERMKDRPEGAVIVSRLENLDVSTDDDGDPQTSCIIIPADGAVNATSGQQECREDRT